MSWSLTLATPDDLAYIDEQIQIVSKHWNSFRAMRRCKFDGTLADIYALEYLIYEGLGVPDLNEQATAAVFGNVIVRNSTLRWHVHSSREFFVATVEDDSFPGACICPRIRLIESQLRRQIGNGWYATTLCSTLFDILARWSEADDKGILKSMLGEGLDDGTYVQGLARAISSIRT